MNGLKNIPAREYYADPFPSPSLSQSMACELALRSPAHAKLKHPKLGAEPQDDDSASRDLGTIWHSLLLSGGEGIEVVDAPDFKSKDAQRLRDLARAHDKTPIVRGKFERAQEGAEIVRRKIEAFGYQFDGDSEICAFWDETTADGVVVQCRGRLDHLSADRCTVFDFKTASNAHPDALQRHIVDMGYDIQAAAYTHAIEMIRPELEGRVGFTFLFCETEPPYPVTPVVPSPSMMMLGKLRWHRAIDRWASCLASGQWPDYVTEPVMIEAPTWVLNRLMGTGRE